MVYLETNLSFLDMLSQPVLLADSVDIMKVTKSTNLEGFRNYRPKLDQVMKLMVGLFE